jgi:hypothetical protein
VRGTAFHQTFIFLPLSRHLPDARIQKNNVRLMVTRHSLLPILILLLISVLVALTTQSAAAQERPDADQPANVAGNWQIQWEARLGTEHATVRFQQDGSKLTGVLHGQLTSQLGSPTVSGKVQGKKVSFTFEFTGKYPFTLTFTGPAEGDTMGGKFEVGGVVSGYDPQGENARPSDYSWKASRIPDQEGQSAQDGKPDKPGH